MIYATLSRIYRKEKIRKHEISYAENIPFITFLSKQPGNSLVSDKLQFLVIYSGNFSLWSLDSYSNISIMMGPFVFSALRNATKNNLINQFVSDYHKVFSLKETFPCNDDVLVTFITFF